jgi:6-phosphogluconate dehydrogenase
MLDPISSSLDNGDILASEFAAKTLAASERPLRQIVQFATAAGVPVPALYSALAWLDARRCPVLGANLIQGQRDLFGAHTFERIDQAGVFHHDWDDQA